MTAGLFECDHVDPAYRAEFGDYSDMFAKLFPELEWRCYDVCNGHFPDDLDECDVYFATGSRHSAYDQLDWIERLKATIRQIAASDKTFVGFCFGHQLLGEALGGLVQKAPAGWLVGVHPFEIQQQATWMQPFQPKLNLLMMCRDQIVGLPPGATVLAGSPQCPAGIIQIGQHMLGIQAHPEFSKAYDQLLMEKRVDRMGTEVVEAGLRSLEREVHREVVRAWVLRFIRK